MHGLDGTRVCFVSQSRCCVSMRAPRSEFFGPMHASKTGGWLDTFLSSSIVRRTLISVKTAQDPTSLLGSILITLPDLSLLGSPDLVMPPAVVQLSFGSFGDIVTLIQITLYIKNLIAGRINLQDELKDLSEFLNNYASVLLAIQSVLQSPQARTLPPTVHNAIVYSIKASVKLLTEFQSRTEASMGSRPGGGEISRLAQVVLRTFWWSFRSQADFEELQKRLRDHSSLITQMFTLCGL